MYCYTRVRIERNLYAELEHAIEKDNSNRLYECVPDIGLALRTDEGVNKKCIITN